MGILNQLSIVFGLLLGQSLAFPFAKAFAWRYTMIIAVSLALVQFVGGFVVRDVKSSEGRQRDEEAPLLPPAPVEERALNLKEVLTPQDKLVRKGCKFLRIALIGLADDLEVVIVIVTQLAQQLCGVSPGESMRFTMTPRSCISVMYFSTRILTPVFQSNSKYIAVFIILIKIPMTLVPAFIVRVSPLCLSLMIDSDHSI